MAKYTGTESALTGFAKKLRPGGSVFFVPRGEVFYYLAMLNESIGNLDKAIRHYERFIASGAHKQFHARARENIAALKKLRASGKYTRPKKNDWRQTWDNGIR